MSRHPKVLSELMRLILVLTIIEQPVRVLKSTNLKVMFSSLHDDKKVEKFHSKLDMKVHR